MTTTDTTPNLTTTDTTNPDGAPLRFALCSDCAAYMRGLGATTPKAELAFGAPCEGAHSRSVPRATSIIETHERAVGLARSRGFAIGMSHDLDLMPPLDVLPDITPAAPALMWEHGELPATATAAAPERAGGGADGPERLVWTPPTPKDAPHVVAARVQLATRLLSAVIQHDGVAAADEHHAEHCVALVRAIEKASE